MYAYSKGESDDDDLNVVEVVKESTMVGAGPVNSSRMSDKSKPVRRLGQTGVAGVESSTMESSVVHIWSSYGQQDRLISSLNWHWRCPAPCCDLSANWKPAVYRPKIVRLHKDAV